MIQTAYQFTNIQKVPLDWPARAILDHMILVDQRNPQESTRHIDEDGLVEALSEVDACRSIPIV